MLVLLIRHADAGDHDPALWPDDTLRPVTDKGRKRHRRVVRRLRRRDLTPTLLLASPWLRAWQTALLTAEVTRGPAPVACPALAAPPTVESIARAVGPQPPDAIVALVGHEPWLGQLASLLLTGSGSALAVDFPKSAVLGLACDSLVPAAGALSFFWRR
ncbi:MAG: histidine phosphatase family protein [Gemmatimonadota bacterium]|nr:histidine phosphatase family protein [Gemmatimonadota bacterium]